MAASDNFELRLRRGMNIDRHWMLYRIRFMWLIDWCYFKLKLLKYVNEETILLHKHAIRVCVCILAKYSQQPDKNSSCFFLHNQWP